MRLRTRAQRRVQWLAIAGAASASLTSQAAVVSTGTGADGALVVSGTILVDSVRTSLTTDLAAGANTLAVANASGFAVGDELLVTTLQGANGAGTYEFVRVGSVSGNSLTVVGGLANAYAGTSSKVIVQRVPNYSSVSVQSGGTLTASAWDGNGGGIVAFRSAGAVSVASGGAITADGLGFRGGIGVVNNNFALGGQGESFAGPGLAATRTANGGAGGGGGFITDSGDSAGGGGGGSYGTAGSNGSGSGDPGFAGGTYGSANLSTLFLGSGGGAGGTDDDNPDSNPKGGDGGRGGGIVFINAGSLSITGSGKLTAAGLRGEDGLGTIGEDETAAGGGGSGGSVFVATSQLTASLLPSTVVAGGLGGGGAGTVAATGRVGGGGGQGILYITEISPVPEPASVGIVATGLLLTLRRRRRVAL